MLLINPDQPRKAAEGLLQVTGGLAVTALDYSVGDCHDYSVGGCGFESHQLLPRKGFLQSLWIPFQDVNARRRASWEASEIPAT